MLDELLFLQIFLCQNFNLIANTLMLAVERLVVAHLLRGLLVQLLLYTVEQLVLLPFHLIYLTILLSDGLFILFKLLFHLCLCNHRFVQLLLKLINRLILLLKAFLKIKQADVSLNVVPLTKSLVITFEAATEIQTKLVLSALVEQIQYSVVLHLLFNDVFQDLNVIPLFLICYCFLPQSLLQLVNCLHVSLTLGYFCRWRAAYSSQVPGQLL